MGAKQEHFMIVISSGDSTTGPQLVLPLFRPISLYEIEDEFDLLTQEVRSVVQNPSIRDEIIEFLEAFQEALNVKSVQPLVEYFILNHGGRLNVNQVKPAFDALSDLIESVTNENRRMN